MIKLIILSLLSGLSFLYLYWRRLKVDYISSQIFTSGFYIILSAGLIGFITSHYESGWWFWTGFLGAVVGLSVGILRFKMRILEAVEAASVAFLPVVSFIFLSGFVKTPGVFLAFGVVIPLLLLALFFILDKKYKGFIWYKSGRIGFAGLSVLGLFFLIRSVVAIVFSDMISFVGSADSLISGILSFISFLAIYNLAQEKT